MLQQMHDTSLLRTPVSKFPKNKGEMNNVHTAVLNQKSLNKIDTKLSFIAVRFSCFVYTTLLISKYDINSLQKQTTDSLWLTGHVNKQKHNSFQV